MLNNISPVGDWRFLFVFMRTFFMSLFEDIFTIQFSFITCS